MIKTIRSTVSQNELVKVKVYIVGQLTVEKNSEDRGNKD